MTMEDLLTKYGTHQESVSHEIYIHATDPASADTTQRVKMYDEWAARDIAELESYLGAMREYRAALAKRYGQLETMSYSLRIDAERRKRETVTYFVHITKVYEDGTEAAETRKTFAGKERAKFFAYLRELEKQYPKAARKYDLEKSRWER